MCLHRSCIVTRDERILFHPTSDHHTDIRREYKIRDDMHSDKEDHVSVECVPVHDLFDLGGWKVKLDQDYKPKWYDKSIEKKVLNKMVLEFEKRASIKHRVYANREGSLEFGDIERFPVDTVLIADDIILLHGMCEPVRGLIVKARQIRIPHIREFGSYHPPFEGCVFQCESLQVQDRYLSRFLQDSGQDQSYNFRRTVGNYNRYRDPAGHNDYIDAVKISQLGLHPKPFQKTIHNSFI